LTYENLSKNNSIITEECSVGNNEKVLICMETTIFTGKKFRVIFSGDFEIYRRKKILRPMENAQ